MSELETAQLPPESLRRVAIDPVSRVEGHGKVTLLLDQDNRVQQARLHIVEFRGFEHFIQGRPYWEVPVMVQRLCGICPVSHHLAASKALDRVVGADRLTPTAEKMRRLMHYGQMLQSHALHFFHLSSPDLLFGFEAEAERRNIVAVAQAHPDIARKGILLRKFGQEVIRLTAGKRVHGTGSVPGGVNKNLSGAERLALAREADQAVAWSEDAVAIIAAMHAGNPALYDRFGHFESPFMCLVDGQGTLDFYDGGLRGIDAQGQILFDGHDAQDYNALITESVKPWSYMKFPYWRDRGPEAGWYRVGPLARVQTCDRMPTPKAQRALEAFKAYHAPGLAFASLAYHWARMIEMLCAAETVQALLQDDDLEGQDWVVQGERRREGVGIIEAPRGTLIHHYQVDENDLVTMANLIVSTTHKNEAMNRAVRDVARTYFDGREVTEGLLNHIEVAIRAYDPCLSCATHALGKMPLVVELHDAQGGLVDRRVRD
jgi:NAD-reducing hydrogenase large subunit